MSTLTWHDRLRVERAVWAFDHRLLDLPRKSRVGRRRALRNDLHSAAEVVGAAAAVRGLGDLRQLAAGYMAAEYGHWQPRPSWTRAAAAAVLFYFLLTWLLEAGSSAFRAGILTAEPRATGNFSWDGIPYLLDDVAFTFTNGVSTSVGGAWRPGAYVVLVLISILAGRLWRHLPALRRPRRWRSEPSTPRCLTDRLPVHANWRTHGPRVPTSQRTPCAPANRRVRASPSEPTAPGTGPAGRDRDGPGKPHARVHHGQRRNPPTSPEL